MFISPDIILCLRTAAHVEPHTCILFVLSLTLRCSNAALLLIRKSVNNPPFKSVWYTFKYKMMLYKALQINTTFVTSVSIDTSNLLWITFISLGYVQHEFYRYML